MGTPYQDVFDAFLARIEELDWALQEDSQVVLEDLTAILKMATNDFRFPRVSLEFDDTNSAFVGTLGNAEIQVVATFMKIHWLRRQINTWRLIKQQYSDKDFALSSQANHLSQLINSLTSAELEGKKILDTYSRSINGRPYPYSNLAGGSAT